MLVFLKWYMIMNLVLLAINLIAWDSIDGSDEVQRMYENYGKSRTKMLMSITFLLIGSPLLVLTLLEKVWLFIK